jgi:hypothetical protein
VSQQGEAAFGNIQVAAGDRAEEAHVLPQQDEDHWQGPEEEGPGRMKRRMVEPSSGTTIPTPVSYEQGASGGGNQDGVEQHQQQHHSSP